MQIIASLFANKTFLLFFIKSNVGFRPANPGIAIIAISIALLLIFNSEKLFKKIIFDFLCSELIFS